MARSRLSRSSGPVDNGRRTAVFPGHYATPSSFAERKRAVMAKTLVARMIAPARTAMLVVLAVATLASVTPAGAATGDLDPTFGDKGVVQTSVGDAGQAEAAAVAQVPGGGVLAVGKAIDTAATRPALVRYTDTGALDTSFSGDGIATLPLTGALSAVVVLPDRSAFVAGQVDDAGATKILVAKVGSSGELEGGFGSGGYTLLPAGDSEVATALALQVVDGQPVVAGSAVELGETKFLVARLTATGALDASFAGGIVLVSIGDGGAAQATGLVALPGGVLIATGSASDAGQRKVALAQLAGSGAVQNTRLVAIGDGGAAEGLAAAASSFKPVVVGSAVDEGKTVMFAARFQASLESDSVFGRDGVLLLPVGDGGNAVASAVGVAGDGRIVVGGRADDDLVGGAYLVKTVLARLNDRGEPDVTFGPESATKGTVLVNIGCDGGEGAAGVAVAPDGRMVAAGGAGTGNGMAFTLARFVDTQIGSAAGGCGGQGVDHDGGGLGACEPSAAIGPLRFEGAGGRLEVRGAMRMNGLTVTTGNGSKLVIDPASSRVYTAADKGLLGKGSIQVLIGDVKIYEGNLDFSVPNKRFSLEDLVLPKGVNFKGFPLVGRPKLEFDAGAVVVSLPVQLPKPFNRVTGDLKIAASMERGVVFDGLAIRAREFALGPLLVRDFVVTYSASFDAWEGKALFVLPFPQRYGAGGGVGFKGGAFAHAEAEINGLNVPIAKAVFLQRVKFGLGVNPLQLTGGIGISAGPSVLGAAAVQIDGNLLWRLPDPPVPGILRADGQVRVIEIPIAEGFLQYTTDGRFDLGGRVQYGLKPFLYISAGMSAYVTSDGQFQAMADGEMCGFVFGPLCPGAKALVNTEWLAACGKVEIAFEELAGGFAHRWGDDGIDFFEGCDLGAYQTPPSPPAANRLLAHRELLENTVAFDPPDARVVAVRATGVGGAIPKIRVDGPGGLTVSSSPTEGAVRQGPFVLAEDPSGATVILIARPPAGRWTVTSLPGSADVAAVTVATALPAPQVRASVTGTGQKRTLRYTVKPQKGQRVKFAERRPKTGEATLFAPLGNATGASGNIAFTPATGPAGQREVVAIVEQDGRPRTSIVVARYTAPAPLRPAAPKQARARRAGAAVVVRFARASGATRYVVELVTGTGRRLYQQVDRPFARFPDAASVRAIDVRVTAVGSNGYSSPIVKGRIAEVGTRTRSLRGTVQTVDKASGRVGLRVGGRTTVLYLRPATRYPGLGGVAALRKGQRVAVLAEVRSFDRKLFALEVRRAQ
jgi:uncharacterized delta-60 repeat protein